MMSSWLESFIGQSQGQEGDLSHISNILINIIEYPIDIIMMIIMSIIAKLMFVYTGGTGKAAKITRYCFYVYSAATVVIGLLSLIAFNSITQGYALNWGPFGGD
jgi:hypothetical protein